MYDFAQNWLQLLFFMKFSNFHMLGWIFYPQQIKNLHDFLH